MHNSTTSQDNREGLGNIVQSLSMPSRLVMVRHGESQANIINRAIKKKIISAYPEGFQEIPDREIRLSPRGRQQAIDTGPWLRDEYPDGFDVIYVSDHTRAKETAAFTCKAAGWGDVQIRIDPLLGERNWGRFASADENLRNIIMENRSRDPLHNPMPDGETLLGTRHRSRELLGRCVRECSEKRVLVFSHGEYIEALWAEIAHMNTEEQIRFFHSDEGDIKNCQVVEFSSVNPGPVEDLRQPRWWVRSSCPQAEIFRDWSAVERATYTPEELLEQVNRYPYLDFPELSL